MVPASITRPRFDTFDYILSDEETDPVFPLLRRSAAESGPAVTAAIPMTPLSPIIVDTQRLAILKQIMADEFATMRLVPVDEPRAELREEAVDSSGPRAVRWWIAILCAAVASGTLVSARPDLRDVLATHGDALVAACTARAWCADLL